MSILGFLGSQNILTPLQHGFRAGSSCETQLVQAVDAWAHSLDLGKQTDMIVFDFGKAFDSVPHQRLLAKLSRNLQWLT